MAKININNFQPGEQAPQKYNSTGPNYSKWGEQESKGYYYDPARDQYFIKPAKPAGLLSTVGPAVGTAAAIKGAELGVSKAFGDGGGIGDTFTFGKATDAAKSYFSPQGENPNILGQAYSGIKDYFGFGDIAAEAAKNASASGAAALSSGEAANAAFNAGADVASGLGADSAANLAAGTPVTEGAAEGAANAGAANAGSSALGTVAGAVGAAYGAKTLYDAYESGDLTQGAMGAVGLGLGLNTLGFALGPVGWAGLAAAAVGAKIFGGKKSHRELEAQRWIEVGKPQMAKYFLEDKFKGKEGELTVEQLVNTPANYTAAKDYDSWSDAQKREFLQNIYNNKKFDWKKGGIYYDYEYAKQLADKIRAGEAVGDTPIVVEERKTKNQMRQEKKEKQRTQTKAEKRASGQKRNLGLMAGV